MGIRAIPIPMQVASYSFPFPFPILSSVTIPTGFPFQLEIPFPWSSLIHINRWPAERASEAITKSKSSSNSYHRS